jgi:hypothetical protein
MMFAKILRRYGTVALVITIVLLLQLYVLYTLPRPSYIKFERNLLRRAKAVELSHVQKVYLQIGSKYYVLRMPQDRKDIARILRAVRSIRLTQRAAAVDELDVILFVLDDASHRPVYVCLDPESAPTVAHNMLSDDLAKVVKEIVKSRKVAPPDKPAQVTPDELPNPDTMAQRWTGNAHWGIKPTKHYAESKFDWSNVTNDTTQAVKTTPARPLGARMRGRE